MEAISLSDIAVVFRGGNGKSTPHGAKKILLRSQDLSQNMVALDGGTLIQLDVDKYDVKEGDLLITLPFQCAVMPEHKDVFAVNYDIIVVRCLKINPFLLREYLRHPSVVGQITSCMTGDFSHWINLAEFSKLKIPVLDQRRQHQVACALRNIAHLVELRSQQSAMLQQLAQSIVHQEMILGKPCVVSKDLENGIADYAI